MSDDKWCTVIQPGRSRGSQTPKVSLYFCTCSAWAQTELYQLYIARCSRPNWLCSSTSIGERTKSPCAQLKVRIERPFRLLAALATGGRPSTAFASFQEGRTDEIGKTVPWTLGCWVTRQVRLNQNSERTQTAVWAQWAPSLPLQLDSHACICAYYEISARS